MSTNSRTPGERVTSLGNERPPVFVLAPPADLLVDLLSHLYTNPPIEGIGDTVPVRVICTPDVLKDVVDALKFGNVAAELTRREVLEIRHHTLDNISPMIVNEGALYGVMRLGRQNYHPCSADEKGSVRVAYNRAAQLWDQATELDGIDAPEWGEIERSLVDYTSKSTFETLDRLIEHRRDLSANGRPGVSSLLVLAGAAGQVQQKDLVGWSEQYNIRSASAISKRKRDLEDKGIISDSQRFTGDGRPASVLDFGDARYHDQPPDRLLEIISEVM